MINVGDKVFLKKSHFGITMSVETIDRETPTGLFIANMRFNKSDNMLFGRHGAPTWIEPASPEDITRFEVVSKLREAYKDKAPQLRNALPSHLNLIELMDKTPEQLNEVAHALTQMNEAVDKFLNIL